MEWEPPQLDATTCRHKQGLRPSPFDLLHAILDHIYTYTKKLYTYTRDLKDVSPARLRRTKQLTHSPIMKTQSKTQTHATV